MFSLEDGREMRFADTRRFGLMRVIRNERLDTDPRLRGLGPEPLDDALSGEYLFGVTRGRRKPVKNFLLDTRAIAGIGNIYACEALFRAAVHPRRQVGRIGAARWNTLTAALKQVLRAAIRAGGTTLKDFLNAEGDAGLFSVSLRVYDREGRPCRRCTAPIRRMVQAGRSTFYCPLCQR